MFITFVLQTTDNELEYFAYFATIFS